MMMRRQAIWTVTVLLLGACGGDVPAESQVSHLNPGGQNQGDPGMGGMPPGRASDTTPPMPVVTHLGPSAPTCCVVARDAQRALYLARPSAMSGGELHIATAAGMGADTQLATGVAVGAYALSPDGRWAIYTAGGALKLAPTAGGQTLTPVASGMQAGRTLAQQSFFTPSGHYLVFGVQPPGVQSSADLHVLDLSNGQDVYHLGDGAFDYLELVTRDDTMVFQNTIGGTQPGTPPVQALFRISLAAAAQGAQPVQIDTHTANVAFSPDEGTIYYTRTSGALMKVGIGGGTPATVATGVVSFAVGPDATVVYTKTDRSVHAASANGDHVVAAAGSVDLFSPLVFSPDSHHLYFFQHVATQGRQGALVHAALPPPMTASAATALLPNASLYDLTFVGDRLLLLQNLDQSGIAGDLVSAGLDGSARMTIGQRAASGAIQVAGNAVATLDAAAQQMSSSQPIDGSPSIVGTLSLTGAPTMNQAAVSPSVHVRGFEFSDDGHALVYVAGARFDTTAAGYVGTLTVRALSGSGQTAASIAGASEIGPVVARAAFVSAPTASPAGLYLLKY
jgi:hypothetical protein